MWDFLKTVLGSPTGSFAFVGGLLALSWWLVHSITKFITEYSIKQGLFNKQMDKTESDIAQIKEDIAFLKGSFGAAIEIKDTLVKKKSPISLTDLGLQLVAEHNLDGIIVDNWLKINTAIQNLKTNNPYDIQEFCLESAFVRANIFFSDKDIDRLKRISYQTGAPLFSIARVMGILIRDRYLKENGIDIGEIDQHAPRPDN